MLKKIQYSLIILSITAFLGCQQLPKESAAKSAPATGEKISIGAWADFITGGGLLEDPTVGENYSGFPFAITKMQGSTTNGKRSIRAHVENLTSSSQALEYKVFWYDINEQLINTGSGGWASFNLGLTSPKSISNTAPVAFASSCNIVVREL